MPIYKQWQDGEAEMKLTHGAPQSHCETVGNLLLSISDMQLPPLVAKLEFNLEKEVLFLALSLEGEG